MSSPVGGAAGGNRRDEARAKAAQLQAHQAAAERRRRTALAALAVALVAALAIGITMVVKSQQDKTAQVDANFGEKGVVSLPAPSGSKAAAKDAVTVRVAADYMCPICNQFEQQTDAWQQQQVKAGKIKQEFIPVSILDRSSNGTQYSTRSAAAAYCVATTDKSKMHDFTKAMYADQPEEGSNGLTDDEIVNIAKKVIPNNKAMNDCITSERYKKYVGKVSDQASKDGLSGTPTVWVNGKQLQLSGQAGLLDQLKKAVSEASAGTKSK